MNQVPNAETVDFTHKSICRLGGVAALIVAVLTLSEVIILTFYPQPSTVSGWFILFQSNKFIGLLDFWGLEVPMYIMFLMVFLATYVVLRKANKGLMTIALIFAILGIGIFLATNNPFSMLSLSNQYAAAKTDMEKSMFLAAGQALLANTNQRAVGGFNMGLLLVSIAGLIVSRVMLRSNIFSKATGFVGILANVITLAEYFRLAFAPEAVFMLLIIASTSGLLLLIWHILIARRLFQLGKETPPNKAGT